MTLTKDRTSKSPKAKNVAKSEVHYAADPRIDIAFKKLFGVEENKDLLMSLINSIVSEEDRVVDVTLMNPYNLQNFKNDKLSILDIKAEDQNGRRYNIEMQISDESDYDKRALFCWAKLYSEQLRQKGQYHTLKKAIGIHILNFLSIPNATKYHNMFRLTEKETGLHFFKDMELHTIELSKFAKDDVVPDELKSYLGKVKTALDRWALFLTKFSLLNPDDLPEELADPAVKKALGTLEEMSFTEKEREAYEDHLKWFRMEYSALNKFGSDKFAEGRAAEKIDMAKKLLASGKLAIKEIAGITGLTEAEIKTLK